MTRFVITELATEDIGQIWDYIAADSSEQADQFIDLIYAEILRVGSSPRIGHRRSDVAAQPTLLFWPVGRYLIVYRTNSEETAILAVLHGSRDIPAVLRDREPDE
jgi:plasmid stabilization system protein ParE